MMMKIEEECVDWSEKGETEINSDTFYKLIRNEIPYIRLRDCIDETKRKSLLNKIEKHSFDTYEDVEPKINRIGCTVFEHDKYSKDQYFNESEIAIAQRDAIFRDTFDPLKYIIDKLSAASGKEASIAKSELGSAYYAGLIRRIEKGTELHIDYAPSEQSGWEVCNVVEQLSWNFYLNVGQEGTGRTTIYKRQWNAADNEFKSGTYGFSDSLVEESDSTVLQPEIGEIVLFNTKNYHIVEPTVGSRVAITSAIGILDSGEVILWS